MELKPHLIKTGLVNFIKNTEAKIYYPGGDNLIGDALALIKQLTEDVERVRKQCGEIIVECDERDAERLKQVAELTKENEDWKAIAEGYQKQFEDCANDRARLTEENVRLKQTITQLGKNNDEIARVYPLAIKEAKADTVREMQEELHRRFGDDANRVFSNYNIHRYIDQIAKEMTTDT